MTDEDDEIVKEQLNLKKLLVNTSKALQVRKVEVAAISEIKKNVALLAAQGVKLPLETRLHITKRMCIVGLSSGSEDEWLSALAIGGSDTWDVKEASFAPLLAELRDIPPQDVAHRIFQEVFCDAVFSSPFMKHLNALNDEQSDAANLVRICQAFLHQCAKQETQALGAGGQARLRCSSLQTCGGQSEACCAFACLCQLTETVRWRTLRISFPRMRRPAASLRTFPRLVAF